MKKENKNTYIVHLKTVKRGTVETAKKVGERKVVTFKRCLFITFMNENKIFFFSNTFISRLIKNSLNHT